MKKINNYIDRSASIITGKKNLEPLYSFKDFPVFFGCVDSLASEDLYADMEWAIDPETGVVQLTKLLIQMVSGINKLVTLLQYQ